MRLNIKDIIPNPANPRVIRDEQFRKLKQSLAQFPQMLEKRPIAVTKEGGKYIALGGNQRLRALLDLKQEIGDADFEQRYTAGAAEMETLLGYFSKGVPVVDCTELTPMQQKRFIIADNVPFGEWDWEGLANEWDVEELADWGLNVPGWEQTEEESEEQVDEINKKDADLYSKKIQAPIYEPTGPKPSISDCINDQKAQELINEIEKSNISNEDKVLLKLAAYRHVVINFEKVANYYANSNKDVQELMEKNALVIIDFKKAIENGFIKLSNELRQQYLKEIDNNENN
jgi:hypothetical protein